MAATATSETTEGPTFLALINKRLRSLRKKQKRITQMEESISEGKTLDKEQQEVLGSKPDVLVLLEELEKLRTPLSVAAAAAQGDRSFSLLQTSERDVLAVIDKRLRALRKKHRRITQMEESISQRKTLNKEQREVLRSKPVVLVLIEELDNLRTTLSPAVSEEISLATQHNLQGTAAANTDPVAVA